MLSTPGDWIYFSEGGKHAIFTHRHLALRIEKSSLAKAAATFVHHDPSLGSKLDVQYELIDAADESSSNSRFRRLIVEPNIGSCFLDDPRYLLLPAAFCSCLYDIAVSSSGRIPPSRLASWQMCIDENNAHLQEFHIKATLLYNHTLLKSPQLTTNKQQTYSPITISVEIKPKAGYIAYSPLVSPAHRCKWYRSRYSLQQELMQRGIVKKGWHKHQNQFSNDATAVNQLEFRCSSYSPLDLFSGDIPKIKDAIEELECNMQNNYRVWCDGTKIFGEYDNLPAFEYKKLLHELMGRQHCDTNVSDPKSTMLYVINQVVSNVIYRENLLQNLLALQKLDVIDGDGAVLIYRRLVSLCNGSQSAAEAILEQNYIPTNETSSTNDYGYNSETLLVASPYSMPQGPQQHLHELLNEIQRFHFYLRNQIQVGLTVDDTVAENYYILCTELVEKLSEEACVFLLSNWLLSLTMCDISFFVTFSLLPPRDDDKSINEFVQRDDSAGMLLCSFEELGLLNAAVSYEIKLIDSDPKPVMKLRNRQEVEKCFQFCEITI